MWPLSLFGRTALVISLAFVATLAGFYQVYSSHIQAQLLARQVVADTRHIKSVVDLTTLLSEKGSLLILPNEASDGMFLTRNPPQLTAPTSYNQQQRDYLQLLSLSLERRDIYMSFVTAETERDNTLLLTIPMETGVWLNARIPIDPINPAGLARLQVITLGLGGLFLLVFYLALYRITRPLKLFLGSTEKLGRDLHRQPLEEKGSAEVKQVARILNTMQYRLQIFVDDRARLLAAISHDLKTPLTRMQLRMEIAEQSPFSDKMLSDINELKTMVESTLDYTRDLDHNEESRRLNLRSLLQSLADDAADTGLSVELLPCDEIVVQARPLELKRALSNLLDNGVKYGDQVKISLTLQKPYARVSFRDQGAGIPASQMELVFKPYFRLESSRSKTTGGSGLGLSIARNIAREHGGDLVLRNLPEAGLEAEFSLLME